MITVALVVLVFAGLFGLVVRSIRWIVFALLAALFLLSPVGFLAVVVVGGAALLLIN